MAASPEIEQGECEVAYENPKCPYLTQINQNTQVNLQTHCGLIALLGEDLTGLNNGVIRTLFQKLEKLSEAQQVQKSWVDNSKPVIITIASVALTVLFEYWILKG